MESLEAKDPSHRRRRSRNQQQIKSLMVSKKNIVNICHRIIKNLGHLKIWFFHKVVKNIFVQLLSEIEKIREIYGLSTCTQFLWKDYEINDVSIKEIHLDLHIVFENKKKCTGHFVNFVKFEFWKFSNLKKLLTIPHFYVARRDQSLIKILNLRIKIKERISSEFLNLFAEQVHQKLFL